MPNGYDRLKTLLDSTKDEDEEEEETTATGSSTKKSGKARLDALLSRTEGSDTPANARSKAAYEELMTSGSSTYRGKDYTMDLPAEPTPSSSRADTLPELQRAIEAGEMHPTEALSRYLGTLNNGPAQGIQENHALTPALQAEFVRRNSGQATGTNFAPNVNLQYQMAQMANRGRAEGTNEEEVAGWVNSKAAPYQGIRNNKDYLANTKADEKYAIKGLYTATGKKAKYNYITNLNGFADSAKKSRENELSKYDFMTDNERKDYTYIANTQGLDAAEGYLDYLDYDLNARASEAAQAAWAKNAQGTGNAIGASATSVLANSVSGLGTLNLLGQNINKALTGKPVDYNAPALNASKYTQTVRGQVAKDIEAAHPNATVAGVNLGSFLYQTGMSMADSAVVALLGSLGVPNPGVILGSSAAVNATLNAKERGLTDAQALTTGIASGIAEMLFEEVSLEKIIHPTTAKSVGGVVKNILRQAFTEGSEEVATTLANTLTDALINGDKSEILTRQRELQANGMSEEEARKAAWKEWWIGLATDALGGALSGGLMGTGANVSNYVSEANYRQTGDAYKQLGMTNDELRDALVNVNQNTYDPYTEEWLGKLTDRAARGEDLMKKLPSAEVGKVMALQAGLTNTVLTQTEYNRIARLNESPYNNVTDEASQTAQETQRATRAEDVPLPARAENAAETQGRTLTLPTVEEAPAQNTQRTLTMPTAEEQRAMAEQYAEARSALGISDSFANTPPVAEEARTEQNAPATLSLPTAEATQQEREAPQTLTLPTVAERQEQNAPQALTLPTVNSRTAETEEQLIERLKKSDAGLAQDDYTATMDQRTVKLLDTLAKKLGLRVAFVDEVNRGKANADITGNVVLIEKGNPNPVRFLIGHEATHWMKRNADGGYNAFEKAARKADAVWFQNREAEIRQTYQRQGISIDEAGIREEAIADYAGLLADNSDTLERFITENKDDRSALEKVRDFFRHVKEFLTGDERAKVERAERRLIQALQQTEQNVAEGKAKGVDPAKAIGDSTGLEESYTKYSLNANTYDYAKAYTGISKQTEVSWDSIRELGEIQKQIGKTIRKDLPAGHWRMNIHNLNEYLAKHPDIWQRLVDIQTEANEKGIAVDFVTPVQESWEIEGQTVEAGLKGFPIEYRKKDGKYIFNGFSRTLSQLFVDRMDPRVRGKMQDEFIAAVEDAYKKRLDMADPAPKLKKMLDAVAGPVAGRNIASKTKNSLQTALRSASKTVMALNFNSACPMFTVGNHGCYLDACYLTQMGAGGNTVNLFQSAIYGGEILQLSQETIDRLNSDPDGLRVNGVGDTIADNKAGFFAALRHAEMRGLKLKIITKQIMTLDLLREAKKQGIDISNVTVQLSMDNLWLPAELDDTWGSGIRGTVGIADTIRTNKNFEAASVAYDEFYGRQTKEANGVLYRKYGFDANRVLELIEEYPEINILPRYVVTTASEIAELALGNGPLGEGPFIQTLMHGVVPVECESDYPGKILNFGSVRHVIEKNADGEWEFFGAKVQKTQGDKSGKGKMVRVNSKAHKIVDDYIKEHYTKAQQETIYTNLQKQICCKASESVDACAGCQSLYGGGCSLCSSVKAGKDFDYTPPADLQSPASDIVSETVKKLRAMVQAQSKSEGKAKEQAEEFSDAETKYSIREKDPPKKVGIAYKVFYAKDGQLYPPMVANPGGAGTPVGVWLDADIGAAAAPSKTGRAQVQAGGKGTSTGKGSLAFRPGWHLGDIPQAKQFARKNPETGKKDLFPADFVWAECEYAMDHDYQDEAMSYGYTENGKFRHSYAGLPKLPIDGYYRYRTNPNPDTVPWVITGAMKVTRILTDEETDAICRENGVEPMKREGGPIDLAKFGLQAGNTEGEIKRSLKESDSAYLSAVNSGDTEAAQRMVDEAAKQAGYTIKAYHGTSNYGFTRFDNYFTKFGLFGNGFYFTESPEVAESYTKKGKGTNPGVYSVFLKANKLIDMDAPADLSKWRKGFRDFDFDESYLDGVSTNEDAFRALKEAMQDAEMYQWEAEETVPDFIQEMGYDGITHMGGGRYGSKDGPSHRVYIVYDSSQVKSAEPVTRTDSGEVIPLSERFNEENDDIRYSLKGLDADAIPESVRRYGRIKPGEKPARDVQVPKKVTEDKNERVSQTIRTVLEAGATPDTAVPTISELVEKGAYSYQVYSDKDAIAKAEDTIKDKGWEAVLTDWVKDVSDGTVNKTNTALGWALYNNAANEGDLDTALNVLDLIVRHQRNAAQAVQATRILKQLTPEAQLYGVQRSVDNLIAEIKQKYGKDVDIQVNRDLARAFLNAKTEEERRKALEALYKDVGRQLPSRFVDKWNAWRYLAMLGNPRTHVRNIVGNAGFAPVVLVKDQVGTMLESIAYRLSGGKMERTKGLVLPGWDHKLVKAAWDRYDDIMDEALGGGKYTDVKAANDAIQQGRVIFKFKPLEWARRGNSAALDKEDIWFNKPHYVYAMAQYCKANDITPAQIASGIGLEKAEAYAIKEAQKATYRDINAFSNFVSNIGRSTDRKTPVGKVASAVIEGILPFRRTPANILARGVEYSPLGLAKSLTYDMYQVMKKDADGNPRMTVAEMLDNVSAGLTGTGLLALGMLLSKLGLLRGHGEDDEKARNFDDLTGHQNYALQLPNGDSYTLDWLAPEALPVFVGVNLYERMLKTKGEMKMNDLLKAISSISEPMLEMSMIQGINDLLETVSFAKNNETSALFGVLSEATISYLTQAFPTLLGQSERTGENVRMTTYTDKNKWLMPDLQYSLGKVSAKTPGWDYDQIPYIDAWGRTEVTGDGWLERAFKNMLNPGYTDKVRMSDMEKELLRLYNVNPEDNGGVLPTRAGRKIGDTDLTGEQYVKYATKKGELSYELVTGIIKSAAYKKATDSERVEMIKDAYDYANEKGRAAAIPGYKPSKNKDWMKEMDETVKATKVSRADYISARYAASQIKGIPDGEGGTVTNSAGLKKMDYLYGLTNLTQTQREAMMADFGVSETLLDSVQSKDDVNGMLEFIDAGIPATEYKDYKIASGVRGIDLDTYMKGYNAYYDADGSGTKTNADWTAVLDKQTFSKDTAQNNYIKGVLWQLYTNSTSTKNNPYDKSGGQYVLDEKAKAKGGGKGTGSNARLVLPTAKKPWEVADDMELRSMNENGGNVDLTNRKSIPVTADNLATVKGWGMDAKVGDHMTVASQTFRDGNTAVVVTPILPDGTLMTQRELEDYWDSLRGTDYTSADKRGIILGVFDSGSWRDNLAESEAFAERVHELHERKTADRRLKLPTVESVPKRSTGRLELPTI